jgi:histidyl-tRNA synthetase
MSRRRPESPEREPGSDAGKRAPDSDRWSERHPTEPDRDRRECAGHATASASAARECDESAEWSRNDGGDRHERRGLEERARDRREQRPGTVAWECGECEEQQPGDRGPDALGSHDGSVATPRPRGKTRRGRQPRRSGPKKGGMNKIAAPRGTADLFPPESARWQSLEAGIHEIARRFGYGEIRTPTFESTDLFVRGVGETTDIVEKEMYTFQDKGDRSLTLRPEWTAPVVRAVLEHNLLAQGPQRLYYIGPIFRYERPQAGRFREAHQFGVECFGYAGPEADVETIALAHEVLRAHGLAVTAAINSIGDAACRPRYREALFAHFAPHRERLSEDSQRRIDRNPLRILDSKAPEDRALVESAPTMLDVLCEPCAEHFRRVRELLDAIGVPYRIDPRIVRGLDYYTRTVFEFISEDLGAQSTVCAGGRYDGLVEHLGGPPTPGVGFGMGIERFMMILAKRSPAGAPERRGIAVVALGESARTRVVPLVAALRRQDGDLPITIDYGDGKIAAHFKKADRANARAAIIVGDDEVAARSVVVRDLATRVQESLTATASDDETAQSVLRWYGALPRATEAAA